MTMIPGLVLCAAVMLAVIFIKRQCQKQLRQYGTALQCQEEVPKQ